MPRSRATVAVSAPGLAPARELATGHCPASLEICRKKPLGTFGAVVLLIMIFVAISPQHPCAPHIVDTKHSKHDAPGTTIPDTHDGTPFLFGTGQLGRDIFSRVVYGARISTCVSLISVGVGTTMGGVVRGASLIRL